MCASVLDIPPSSLDSRSSGISLCAELTLVTIEHGQGACLEDSQSVTLNANTPHQCSWRRRYMAPEGMLTLFSESLTRLR